MRRVEPDKCRDTPNTDKLSGGLSTCEQATRWEHGSSQLCTTDDYTSHGHCFESMTNDKIEEERRHACVTSANGRALPA